MKNWNVKGGGNPLKQFKGLAQKDDLDIVLGKKFYEKISNLIIIKQTPVTNHRQGFALLTRIKIF